MTDPIQTARERFSQGFNCSQSVLVAFASDCGISEETALKLASPFGGGVARKGNVCGAVSGALMALGLRNGNATLENKEKNYQLAEIFLRQFEERHGTILCRELISYDLSIPEELQKARDQKVFNALCPRFVADAAEIVNEIIKG